MNSQEAITKIKNLLFGKQSFGLMKTIEGIEVSTEGDVALDSPIYAITPDGQMPLEDGTYTMEDGMVIEVLENKVKEISYETAEEVAEAVTEEEQETEMTEHETEEEKMVSAELIDGTLVETDSDEITVGDILYVVTADGRSIAPAGEHETSDGKLIVVSEDGSVTEIKEKEVELVEEEMGKKDFEELLTLFTEGFTKLNDELTTLKDHYEKMNSEFRMFKGEPAGERLYFNQEFKTQYKEKQYSKLSALAELRKLNKK